MAELQVNEGVKLTGLPEGWANAQALQQVILWDIGPEEPIEPKVMAVPKGNDGEPAYELAKVRFGVAMKKYKAALEAYDRAVTEFEDWHRRNGGPIEITFWSCDANDALERDAKAVADKNSLQVKRRYYISARTRGYGKLPNRGLPEGMHPGHGQAELERRQREGDADMAAALRADPVFGNPELRQ